MIKQLPYSHQVVLNVPYQQQMKKLNIFGKKEFWHFKTGIHGLNVRFLPTNQRSKDPFYRWTHYSFIIWDFSRRFWSSRTSSSICRSFDCCSCFNFNWNQFGWSGNSVSSPTSSRTDLKTEIRFSKFMIFLKFYNDSVLTISNVLL